MSHDPQFTPQPVKEQPSDLGRKALFAILFVCVIVVFAVAINIWRQSSADANLATGDLPSARSNAYDPAQLERNFSDDLTKRRRRIQAEQAARAKPTGLIPTTATATPTTPATVAPTKTPAELWREQQELEALRRLSSPMTVEGERVDEDVTTTTIEADPNGTVVIENTVPTSQEIDARLQQYQEQLQKEDEQ